jgi:hypothetical protein
MLWVLVGSLSKSSSLSQIFSHALVLRFLPVPHSHYKQNRVQESHL